VAGRWARALLIAAALAAAACQTPVHVQRIGVRNAYRALTENAIGSDDPSGATRNVLRRYDLLEAFGKDPAAALAELHRIAMAEPLPDAELFALAELSLLHARRERDRRWFLAGALYAYAYLFPEEGPRPDPIDGRVRVAADLYNLALTEALRPADHGRVVLEPGVVILPFAQVRVDFDPAALRWRGRTFGDLLPVGDLAVRGLRNRYRTPGIGAPLSAKPEFQEGPHIPDDLINPNIRIPVTAFLRVESPRRQLRQGSVGATLELYAIPDERMVTVGSQRIALEAEPTASLAAALAESRFWKVELARFMGNLTGWLQEPHLAALEPYRAGRRIAVFVHGTASSPARWADMVNDLTNDLAIQQRYQTWFFAYDSGNPIAYSAYHLRRLLTAAVERIDPSGADPCARSVVVLGHSQGGLLTKMTAIDSGDRFWADVSDRPFDEVAFPEETRELLRAGLFVKPLPFVRRLVFMATPHRGSYLAGPQFVRRLAERFVRLPGELARTGADLANLGSGTSYLRVQRIPTSIDNMSPSQPFIRTLASIPWDRSVTAHSIIAVQGDGPIESGNDGVVEYRSAHVEGVASELVVRSSHSMQANPRAIEEVRRILLEHAASDACGEPGAAPDRG
jgi:triacylglycerol esterase/lipase EstA (alpha/beta hydrolase family)